MFQGIKRYLPRSLYGRAALILILPVVTLQLVVSVVFIQRHFTDVTEQLSRDVARDVSVAIDTPELARALGLQLREVDQASLPDDNQRRWYDLTGLVVIRTLRDRLPGLERVMLPDDRVFRLYLRSGGRLIEVEAARNLASAANAHQLLVNMVFFGGLMTLIAFLYLRNQLRPITRLASAAEAFGRGSTVPYSPSGANEVRAAGHAFLDMRNRIERQIEQRTLMLSGISHDLRTPLTRMRLGLSLLEDADRAPLERDVDDMQYLVDAFLDFARGDAEASQAEKIDVADFLQRIVADAQRSGQAVQLTECADIDEVTLRPRAMRRAIDNLIGNAGRYGGRCHVSLTASPKTICFRVEDDGPGIPPEAREQALRPFVRLDPARNQDKGSGVGLGLAIAADIARAHGGMLRLGESASLGGLRADIVISRWTGDRDGT